MTIYFHHASIPAPLLSSTVIKNQTSSSTLIYNVLICWLDPKIVSPGRRNISVYQRLQKSASYSDSIKVKDTDSCKKSLSFLRAERTDGEFPGPAVCVKIHRRCSSDALKKSSTKLPPTVCLASAAARKLKPTFLFPLLISPFLSAPSVDCAVPQRRRRGSVANESDKQTQTRATHGSRCKQVIWPNIYGGGKHNANQKATLRFLSRRTRARQTVVSSGRVMLRDASASAQPR